jgi:hypothetical protein
MRTTVVLAALVVLAVSITWDWWAVSVGTFVGYVIWTFIRIPLERRKRLRGFEIINPKDYR